MVPGWACRPCTGVCRTGWPWGAVTEKEGERGLCQAVGGRAPCPPHRGALGLGAVGWPLEQPGGPQAQQGLLLCTR